MQKKSKPNLLTYTVTFGAFSDFNNAQKWMKKLQNMDPSTDFFIEEDPVKNLHRVNGGRLNTRRDGLAIEAKFKREKVDCYTRKIL